MAHKIGVVGGGTIAVNRHIPVYLRNDSIDLVGVYDRNKSALSNVKNTFGVRTFTNLDDLYAASDTIVVCTPPWSHHEITLDALANDCHVLTEKPMAMSTDEAEEMIDAASDSGKQLAVVHNNLWKRSVKEAVKKVESADLGSIRRTHAIQLREMDDWERHSQEWFEKLPGGLFWDEAPHMMYLTRQFLGDTTIVSANADSGGSSLQRETAVRARFEGENNTRGGLTMIFDAPVTEWWFVVLCSRGLVAIDIFRNAAIVFTKEEDHTAFRVLSSFMSFVAQASSDIVLTGLEYLWERAIHDYSIPDAGFSAQVSETIRAFESGVSPPVSGKDGLETVRMMEEIAENASLQ